MTISLFYQVAAKHFHQNSLNGPDMTETTNYMLS